MRVRYQAAPHPEKDSFLKSVGVAGFEPATSCSQSRRDNRATLHPENDGKNINTYELNKRTTLHPEEVCKYSIINIYMALY